MAIIQKIKQMINRRSLDRRLKKAGITAKGSDQLLNPGSTFKVIPPVKMPIGPEPGQVLHPSFKSELVPQKMPIPKLLKDRKKASQTRDINVTPPRRVIPPIRMPDAGPARRIRQRYNVSPILKN